LLPIFQLACSFLFFFSRNKTAGVLWLLIARFIIAKMNDRLQQMSPSQGRESSCLRADSPLSHAVMRHLTAIHANIPGQVQLTGQGRAREPVSRRGHTLLLRLEHLVQGSKVDILSQ
jgi:hypothetical protein